MNEVVKRKRGGQPGNHNARKHGFYSMALDRDQQRLLKQAAGVENLDQEVDLIRLKLRELMQKSPENTVLIEKTAACLVSLIKCQKKLQNNYKQSVFIRNLAAFISKLDLTRGADSPGPGSSG